jgi:hypothetical protein
MDDAGQDLPEAAVEHVSQMLTLAKSKRQEAVALLGTPGRHYCIPSMPTFEVRQMNDS